MAQTDETSPVLQRFFALFGGLADTELARTLGVAARTVGRLRASEHRPAPETATKMEQAIRRAEADPAELLRLAEEMKEQRAAEQRRIKASNIPSYLLTTAPAWYKRLVEYVIAGEYDKVPLIVEGQVGSINAVSDIQPPVFRARVSAFLGMTYYYQGDVDAATRRFEEAIGFAKEYNLHVDDKRLFAGLYSNLAIALGRRARIAEAMEAANSALEVEHNFAPALYNALCVASLARDNTLLAEWCGRTKECARAANDRTLFSEMRIRMEDDHDLEWAWGQSSYMSLSEFLTQITESHDAVATAEQERS